MRLLVCGSRDWTDRVLIRSTLASLAEVDVVIHGAAPGADRLAGEVARELGIPVLAFPADWDKHGRAAGPIRNAQMLREGRPHLILAFHDALEHSRGTRDMVAKAKRAGRPVRLITHVPTGSD
jgi:hypothetical protein